jgi:hypothetical protein
VGTSVVFGPNPRIDNEASARKWLRKSAEIRAMIYVGCDITAKCRVKIMSEKSNDRTILTNWTWSRLRREITCDLTALAVQTQEVIPITMAMVTGASFIPGPIAEGIQDQENKGRIT